MELSTRTVLALLPLLVLTLGLVVYALVDVVRAPSVKYLPKVVWVLIIVLLSMPLGALAYLIFGRCRGESSHTAGQDDGAQREELHSR